MILATHIIGLTSWEGGALASSSRPNAEKAAICAAIKARWEQIRSGGELIARDLQPERTRPKRDPLADTGRSFAYDDLAGDGRYIFLEVPSRYLDLDRYMPASIWGWQFDAELLVAHGALVSLGDLGGEYDDLIYACCVEVAATLPRLPRISDDELTDFAAKMRETDSDLLAYVAAESENPTDALWNAVQGYESSDPLPSEAVEQARSLITERIRVLQQARRRTGAAALELLRSGQHCEVLVAGRLAIASAMREVRAGVVTSGDEDER